VMREIKFRMPVKCNLCGEFHYYFYEINGCSSSLVIYDIGIKENTCKCWLPVRVGDDEQFTGLHDKNGEEIFEGDVVTRKWLRPYAPKSVKERQMISLVKFNDEEKWFSFFTCFNSGGSSESHGLKDTNTYHEIYEIEVIGNITENPELLK
jgi:hypothetical protein